jgi:hypothetical protein
MESKKSQELYLLLNRYDRSNESVQSGLKECETSYPYFYLLNWNLSQDTLLQRKIALQSPFRTQYYYSILDAPVQQYQINLNETVIHLSEQNDIIDKFLTNQPSLTRPKKSTEDVSEINDLSEIPFSPPISETFAIILIKQGKISLAIDIYTKLMLSKPEKRLYFASQISELSKLLNQN